jgi:DNA-binding XRE family transcriptional regulator
MASFALPNSLASRAGFGNVEKRLWLRSRGAPSRHPAAELATFKDLRHAVLRTQEDLATALGVGQDTISRLEQRSDMLLSTLKRYVEAMGGKLDLVVRFPNRPPVIIEQIAEPRGQQKPFAKGPRTGKRHTAEVV